MLQDSNLRLQPLGHFISSFERPKGSGTTFGNPELHLFPLSDFQMIMKTSGNPKGPFEDMAHFAAVCRGTWVILAVKCSQSRESLMSSDDCPWSYSTRAFKLLKSVSAACLFFEINGTF